MGICGLVIAGCCFVYFVLCTCLVIVVVVACLDLFLVVDGLRFVLLMFSGCGCTVWCLLLVCLIVFVVSFNSVVCFVVVFSFRVVLI